MNAQATPTTANTLRRIHLRMQGGSPEWLHARCGLFTASRAADLLAKGRGSAPAKARTDYIAEIAVERLTGRHLERYVSPAMQRGLDLEAEALAAYAARTGELTEAGGFWRFDDLAAGASPDALVGAEGLVQIKCPANSTAHLRALKGEVDEGYVLQCQWELWVTGRNWNDLTSYDPRFPDDLRIAVTRVTPETGLHERFAREVEAADAEVRALIGELRHWTTA